jgi:hypothetical protein
MWAITIRTLATTGKLMKTLLLAASIVSLGAEFASAEMHKDTDGIVRLFWTICSIPHPAVSRIQLVCVSIP